MEAAGEDFRLQYLASTNSQKKDFKYIFEEEFLIQIIKMRYYHMHDDDVIVGPFTTVPFVAKVLNSTDAEFAPIIFIFYAKGRRDYTFKRGYDLMRMYYRRLNVKALLDAQSERKFDMLIDRALPTLADNDRMLLPAGQVS
jgi:hypothetical protein